jgi:CRISPR-associated protein Csh1
MIYDVLEEFNKEYRLKGDKLILDNYQLKEGVYLRIDDKTNSCEVFVKSSKKVKKDGQNETEHYFKNIEGELQNQEYDWFRQRDYFSNVIDTGKAFDAPKKTIHNNNYLTLFMKIEEFLNLEFSHIETKLYKKVLSFKDFHSKNEKKILENFCSSIKLLSRKKDIVKKMRWIESTLDTYRDIVKDHNPKEYIRIYFTQSEEVYKNESAIYLALKIYNKNEYSVEVDKVVYGLSNDNMGLNGKKPFLEQKTKKSTTPFMITSQVAMQSKLFFDWLGLQPYKTDLFEHMFLKKHSDNGKAIINDFDYLPVKIEKLESSIKIKNYLQVKDREDYEIKDLFMLENVVDEVFYNKQLKHNYFRDDLKVSDFISKKLQQLIFETKYAMVNYFKKFDEREFYQVVKKYGNDFVIEHLRQNRGMKASESLNLKFSLLQYKGEEVMDIKSMQDKMIEKLETSDYKNLRSEEFFYLCGQVAKYLLSKSKSGKKDADMLEPFLRAKNVKKLRDEIKFTFFKYKHEIGLNQAKFNNAMSLITAYDGQEQINSDSFLVGILSQNLFYMKKGESENE